MTLVILGKGLAPVQSPSQPQPNKGGVNKGWDVRRGRGAGLLGAHGSQAVRMVRLPLGAALPLMARCAH